MLSRMEDSQVSEFSDSQLENLFVEVTSELSCANMNEFGWNDIKKAANSAVDTVSDAADTVVKEVDKAIP